MSDQAYFLRIQVLKRVIAAEPLPNGEDDQSWPVPLSGNWRHSAKQVSLNAGEEIRQGVKESMDFMKLEIKGKNLGIDAVDRIQVVETGRIYRITAEPIRGQRTTTISLESV